MKYFKNFILFFIIPILLNFGAVQINTQRDVGYTAHAAQVNKEQNFNTVLRKILAGNADTEIPQQFQSVAFKTVFHSETTKYNGKKRDFNGVPALREMFGDEKKKFDTTFIYLSKDKPIISKGSVTWYLMYTYANGGTQYRLYYQKNPAIEAMNTDDVLFIAKTKDDKVFMIITNKESPAKDKLLASFNEKPAADTTKEKGIKEVSNVTALPLQIEPTTSWIKVYFTPGLDCEKNIISRLNEAKKNIDIAVYSITNENIVNAVIAAHKRGVKVRVMTDFQQSTGNKSRVQELIDAGVSVRTNKGTEHKIEHNKFAIFDGKEMTTGSYNWTWNASNSNSENCNFFKQPGNEYSSRYEYLWKFYDPSQKETKVSFFCGENMLRVR